MFIQPFMLAGLFDFYLKLKKKKKAVQKKGYFLSECALKSLTPVLARAMCNEGWGRMLLGVQGCL